MQQMVILDAAEVEWLRELLDRYGDDAYRLRLMVGGRGLTVKVNEDMWSPEVGSVLPRG